MRIKEGFNLRLVAGENVISGDSLEQINYNKIIVLNSSATFLWKQLEGKEFSCETLAQLLMQEYDIEPERADADARAISQSWLDVAIVEP